MAVQEEVRKEHKQEFRTILVLCCCCSYIILLPLACRMLMVPVGKYYVLNHGVGAEPHLNNFNKHLAKSEIGPSVWQSSEPAAIVGTTTRLPEGEKYMWYSPHGGFSNQARELMNALKIAFLLNRTLILPPVLDHFELEQGTCFGPQHDPRELRKLAWTAITGRFAPSSPRAYVSIADIIDLSSIKSTVKTIDLRVFLALWCRIDITPACLGPLCHNLARDLTARPPGTISSCAAQFFPTAAAGNKRSNFIYEIQDDCRTTIWTHGESTAEKMFLEQQLRELLHNDTTLPSDVDASSLHIRRKDVVETLGPASSAAGSSLLTFGTLFGRYYGDRTMMVDIMGSTLKQTMASILTAIEHQTFSVDIVNAGQNLLKEKIKGPFFCAHVRLEDGAFIFDQEEKIFKPLRQRLAELEMLSTTHHTTREPINVFVMTDLPREKWQGTYLNNLNDDPKYKIHTMDGEEDLLVELIQKMENHEYGLQHGFLPQISNLRQIRSSPLHRISRLKLEGDKTHQFHASDVRLFVEEVVCSCAKLGFQGTLVSTITRNILKMREAKTCPI